MQDQHVQWALNEFSKEVNYIAEQITHGNAQDFADYRRGCGYIRGMERAREILLKAIDDDAKDEGSE